MELPDLRVLTAPFAYPTCAVCDTPCEHEDPATGQPYPGAYTRDTETDWSHPICDHCVERHYPDRVAEVEAERLHYWSN